MFQTFPPLHSLKTQRISFKAYYDEAAEGWKRASVDRTMGVMSPLMIAKPTQAASLYNTGSKLNQHRQQVVVKSQVFPSHRLLISYVYIYHIYTYTYKIN